VRKAQLCAGFVGIEFDCDDRFCAFGGGREP
jgi:hypothetical protein